MPLIVPWTWRRALPRRRPACWRRPGRSRCGCGCRAGRADRRGRPRRRPRRPPRAACRRWCRRGRSRRRPASAAAWSVCKRVVGVALEAVEEVLGVVDHLAARAPRRRRPSRRSSAGSRRARRRGPRGRAGPSVLPTIVTTGVRGGDQGLHPGVVLGGDVPCGGSCRRRRPWRASGRSSRTARKYAASLGLESG